MHNTASSSRASKPPFVPRSASQASNTSDSSHLSNSANAAAARPPMSGNNGNGPRRILNNNNNAMMPSPPRNVHRLNTGSSSASANGRTGSPASPATSNNSPTKSQSRWSGSTSTLTSPNSPISIIKRTPLNLTTSSAKPAPSQPQQLQIKLTSNNNNNKTSSQYQHALRQKYEQVLGRTNRTEKELRESLKVLRKLVVVEGLPELSEDTHKCTLRGRIWKSLLGIHRISAAEYVSFLDRKEYSAEVFEKIKNDTFRTLATDKRFLERVNEGMLGRVLNAFVWKARDFPSSRLSPLSFSYVQGMNVLLAPFLYVMPELDSFFAFTSFIEESCPLYVQQSLEGAHCGMKLMDICLYTLDPELYFFLRAKNLEAKVYAMAPILTFCASLQPLDEVLVLWDFLLAYGVHLNVLAVVAQLEFAREEIMKSDSPMKHLRSLPPLRARPTIDLITTHLLPRIPDSLYDLLSRHPWDPSVYSVLQSVEGSSSPGGAEQMGMSSAELMSCIEIF